MNEFIPQGDVPQGDKTKETAAGEIRPEIQQRIAFVESVLSGLPLYTFSEKDEEGKLKDYPAEDPSDPSQTFNGLIFDENDESHTEAERTFLLEWFVSKLGSPIEQASIKETMVSPEKTRGKIFSVSLGKEDDSWRLTVWQNESDEKPVYMLIHEDMLDLYEMDGYERIPHT